MFERLKRLYNEGKIDAEALEKAVEKGWITEEQKNELSNAISLLRVACGDTDINNLSKSIELLENLYSRY